MDYGCPGSSTKTLNAAGYLALKGYKVSSAINPDTPLSPANPLFASSALIDYQENWVINSLRRKRPVMIEGCAFKSKVEQKILGITYNTYWQYNKCHSWVIDGYLKKNVMYYYYLTNGNITSLYEPAVFFHSNWGWSGDKNGYQVTDIFTHSKATPLESKTKSGEEGNYQYRLKIIPNIYK
jgi:hypothetical protein